jgi:hypothetical protein
MPSKGVVLKEALISSNQSIRHVLWQIKYQSPVRRFTEPEFVTILNYSDNGGSHAGNKKHPHSG